MSNARAAAWPPAGEHSELLSLLEQFDRAWQGHTPPRIDEFLPPRSAIAGAETETSRRAQLEELIQIDLEYRWRRASPDGAESPTRGSDEGSPDPDPLPWRPLLEDYLAHYPELGSPELFPPALIGEEYRVRHRWGDRPGREEYAARFASRCEALDATLAAIDAELASEAGPAHPASTDDLATIAARPASPPRCRDSSAPDAEGPEAPAVPPMRIGKYLVIELVGEGGQAQVFRVHDHELGKDRAIKLARRPIEVGIESQGDRLKNEAWLLAHCEHPNLVQVHDLGVHEGRLFVVMDYVPGQTLEQFAEQHGPDPRQTARIVAELARAVAYLHDQRIVHQDIKPGNVLVDAQDRPRLIDFGLARLRHAWSADTTRWTGGTAAYMSPEQARGRADQIGHRTDVFGLGGLLYHLLTGRPPYQGASRPCVLRQALNAEYLPVRQVNPRAPRALERICHKALAADPERRYRTAVELERALRWFLARRQIAAAGLIVLSLLAAALIAPRPRPRQSDPGRAVIPPSAAAHCGGVMEVTKETPGGTRARSKPPWQRVLPGEDAERVKALVKQMYDLEKKGRFAEAFERARDIFEIRKHVQGDDHWQTVEARFRASAWEKVRTLPHTHQSDLAAALRQTEEAVKLNQSGRYAEAASTWRKIREVFSQILGENDPLTCLWDNNWAVNLYEQKKYDEAAQLNLRAWKNGKSWLGEDQPREALIFSHLAEIDKATGKYHEAEWFYSKSLAIRLDTLGENHVDTSRSYSDLANYLYEQKKHAEAEPFYQKSLVIRLRTLGEGHRVTALTSNNLATALYYQGKHSEAEAKTITAVRSFEAARPRDSFSGRYQPKTARVETSLLSLATTMMARRGRGAEAWQHWESALGRGLFDNLVVRRSGFLTPDERRRKDHLIAHIDRLDNEISALAAGHSLDDDQLDKLNGQRQESLSRLAHIESELIKRCGVAAGAVYALDQIQAQLPADAALVGWLDIQTRPNAANVEGDHWACVVRHTGAPRWIRIVGTGPNGAWTQVDEERPGRVLLLLSSEIEKDWQTPLSEMAKQRLTSLEAALGAHDGLPTVRHLIVLSSSGGILIEPLLEARPTASSHYLVSYAPSGTLFAWLQKRRRDDRGSPAQPRRLLALGNPVPPPSEKPASKPHDEGDALLHRSRDADFDSLPGSRSEVQAVASLFDRSEVYLGSHASEQKLDMLRSNGQLNAFSVIHLATHGEIDDLAPMNSRLLLSQDKRPDPAAALSLDGPVYDGMLTAGEVMSTWKWKLNAELVTLSACRTAMGRLSGGEGFDGFAQAFFLAGSRSVILSLWEVDDRATLLLMTRFYQNWLGKRPGLSHPLSKAEALHKAKAWLRGLTGAAAMRELDAITRGEPRNRSRPPSATHPFAHPHYWAAFILMGDPN
jgi:CHAT domain-containing protein/serine/threonine protein kinase